MTLFDYYGRMCRIVLSTHPTGTVKLTLKEVSSNRNIKVLTVALPFETRAGEACFSPDMEAMRVYEYLLRMQLVSKPLRQINMKGKPLHNIIVCKVQVEAF